MTPITRQEQYFAYLAGMTSDFDALPEPVSREDEYLYHLCLQSSVGGSGSTTNYNALSNRPQINGVTLTGNQTGEALGLLDGVNKITKAQIDALFE